MDQRTSYRASDTKDSTVHLAPLTMMIAIGSEGSVNTQQIRYNNCCVARDNYDK